MSINSINTNKNSKYDSVNNNRSVNTSNSTAFSKSLESAVSNMSKGSLEQIFKSASVKYSVPENLLKAVAKAESDFNPNAQSSAGAQGIMQLMPATARELGVNNSFNAEQNIMGGAKYLRQLLDRFDGNIQLAVASYNAGPGNVEKYDGIPPFKETQNYVKKVMQYSGEDISTKAIDASSSLNTAKTVYSLENMGLTMPDVSSTKDKLAKQIILNYYLYQLKASLLQNSDSDSDSLFDKSLLNNKI